MQNGQHCDSVDKSAFILMDFMVYSSHFHYPRGKRWLSSTRKCQQLHPIAKSANEKSFCFHTTRFHAFLLYHLSFPTNTHLATAPAYLVVVITAICALLSETDVLAFGCSGCKEGSCLEEMTSSSLSRIFDSHFNEQITWRTFYVRISRK